MDAFLKYFYQDIGLIWQSIVTIFSSIFQSFNTIFNFPMRMRIVQSYGEELGAVGWILVVLSNLLIAFIAAVIIFFIVRGIKRLAKLRAPITENEQLRNDNARLQRELLKLGYEKDKILAMKMTEHGIEPMKEMLPGMDMEDEEGEGEEGEEGKEFVPNNRNTFDGPLINPDDSRFFRLTSVDNYYKATYEPPEYDDEIKLPEFCTRFKTLQLPVWGCSTMMKQSGGSCPQWVPAD